MSPILALIACTVFVAVLLSIERSHNREASLGLLVPTVWMLIYASRPLGRWFDMSGVGEAGVESGSPIDRMVLSVLIGLALLILLARKLDWNRIVNDNFWLIVFFLYLGMSILWSEIPLASSKRWIRSIGDILMACVVLSERKPLQALESVLRRCAYVLVPFSLMLSKFYPHLGREYGRWSGMEMWTGVTMQKNSLGQLCALSAFLLIWALLRERRTGGLQKAALRRTADLLVLLIALFLLIGPSSYSRSATSVSIFLIGIAVLLLLNQRERFARYVAQQLKALALSLSLMYVLLYDSLVKIVTSLLERDETLTGRTDIWRPLLEYASDNPILGVGYGGFWAPGNWELEDLFTPQFILTQAHNGYLAIYVELGIVGLVLLAVFLLAYCNAVRRQLDRSFDWGVYGICLLPMSLIYNNSEVSFLQSSSYLWSTMVFLTIVFSTAGGKNSEDAKMDTATLVTEDRIRAKKHPY